MKTEMVAVLPRPSDLTALLDVTHPEPPPEDSPLLAMSNVFLTPHISGSAGRECYRMGRFVTEEVRHYLASQKLQGELTRVRAELMA